MTTLRYELHFYLGYQISHEKLLKRLPKVEKLKEKKDWMQRNTILSNISLLKMFHLLR